MSKSAKLSINNALMGDYTAQIEIGSEKYIANVILDTGSSTLAVWKNKFGSILEYKTHPDSGWNRRSNFYPVSGSVDEKVWSRLFLFGI